MHSTYTPVYSDSLARHCVGDVRIRSTTRLNLHLRTVTVSTAMRLSNYFGLTHIAIGKNCRVLFAVDVFTIVSSEEKKKQQNFNHEPFRYILTFPILITWKVFKMTTARGVKAIYMVCVNQVLD